MGSTLAHFINPCRTQKGVEPSSAQNSSVGREVKANASLAADQMHLGEPPSASAEPHPHTVSLTVTHCGGTLDGDDSPHEEWGQDTGVTALALAEI